MLQTNLRDILDADVIAACEAIPNFAGSSVEVSVQFTNTREPSANRPLVVVEKEDDAAQAASFGSPGNNLHRKTGRLMIHVLTVVDSGTGLSDHIVASLEAYFLNRSSTNFRYFVPRLSGPGFRLGADWRVTLVVPFRADRRA